MISISIYNRRGPDPSRLHVLPTSGSAMKGPQPAWNPREPALRRLEGSTTCPTIAAEHPELGLFYLYCDGNVPLLFTENETNTQRLFGVPNVTPYVKDGINNYVVLGQHDAVNHGATGTKASAHYQLAIGPGRHEVINLRFTETGPEDSLRLYGPHGPFGGHYEEMFRTRKQEADEFFEAITPPALNRDEADVMRQALSGMLWSKQFYYYDVDQWLEGGGAGPFTPNRKAAPRNEHWHHMFNGDVISMPDKWEYPWYAAWDLAFHVLPLSLVDPDFGKQQLELMLREHYMHPNGQIPAYEWNFGDVNPPVHAWATIFTYRLEKAHSGQGDKEWLKSSFRKLLLNFTWWVNRKDPLGAERLRGGFLGWTNRRGLRSRCPRCQPAISPGRPTVPPGWPSTARTCSRSRRNWPYTEPDYVDMYTSSFNTFSGSPRQWLMQATTRECGTRKMDSSTMC